jgi:predicted methyltransferase
MWSAVQFSHRAIESIGTCSTAVDATAGRGKDSAFLLGQIEPAGIVISTDIQEEAICATRELNVDNAERLRLHKRSHAELREIFTVESVTSIDCAMFNLGYLPNSDSTIITTPLSTCKAIGVCCEYLRPGGIITVVLYRGHPGGTVEAEAVEQLFMQFCNEDFSGTRYSRIGMPQSPECLVLTRIL